MEVLGRIKMSLGGASATIFHGPKNRHPPRPGSAARGNNMRSARAPIIGTLDPLMELMAGLKTKWAARRAISAGIVTHQPTSFVLRDGRFPTCWRPFWRRYELRYIRRIVKFDIRSRRISQIVRQPVGSVCMDEIPRPD